MAKKIICLAVLLIMLFSLTACGDYQGKFDELQNKIDKQSDRITELENELNDSYVNNTESQERIQQLENELRLLKGEFTADEFLLTITVDRNTVVQGETVTVTATLENKTGRSFFYFASYESLIHRQLDVSPYWDFDDTPDVVDPPQPSWWFFEKDGYIRRTIILQTYSGGSGSKYQEAGIYEITASAYYHSWINYEHYTNISSNMIEITVLEKS